MMRAKPWLVVLAVLTGVSCAEKEEEVEPILRSVRYVVAENEGGPRERTFSGQVQASNQARLSFQVAGRIQSVDVKMGDRVEEGQRIATLDPIDFQLQLEEARASLAQARAQARSAEATYARVRALYENRNASVQDLDNARAQKDTALSMVSAASKSVSRLQRQLQYATLTAGAAGIIREVNVEANEVVGAGAQVALLQAGEQLEVSVSIPETYVNRVSRGMKVTCSITALGVEVPGVVSEIGVPGQNSGAFPVRVRIGESSEKVEAGMAADVTFRFEADVARKGVFLLPTTAVSEDREGRFVFIVEQDESDLGPEEGVVRRRSVTTGDIETAGIEVVEGLKGGEKVVTAGVSRIYEGLRVKVPEVQQEY